MSKTPQQKADKLFALAREAGALRRSVPMSDELHRALYKIEERYRKRAKKLAGGPSCRHCGVLPRSKVADHKPGCPARLRAELASTGWYG